MTGITFGLENIYCSAAALFQLSQVVSDISYLGVGHFAGTFPALSEIYIIQPHPYVPALVIGDKNQTHYDEYQHQ